MKKTISRKSVVKAQPKRVVKSTTSASKPLAKAKTGGTTKSLTKAQKGVITNNGYVGDPNIILRNKRKAKVYGTRNDGNKSGTDYTAAQKWGSTMPREKTSVVRGEGKRAVTKAVPKTTKKKTTPSGKNRAFESTLGYKPPRPTFRSAYEDPNYVELMRKLNSPDESTYSRDKMTKTKTKIKTPTKPKGKTVAEVWKDKTGLSWSDAKKLGYSDGTSSSNLKLLKKLNDGEITRNSIMGYDKSPEPVNPTISPKAVTTSGGSGMGAIEREMAMAEETFRKGGSVKKYKRGGTIKSKKK